MFEFAKNLWRMGRLSEEQLAQLVTNGRLTEEQADEIRALPHA